MLQDEPLVFQQTIEGLVRSLGPALDTSCRERLKQRASLDLSRPLLPAYPFADFVTMLKVAAEAVAPGAPEPEGMYRVGRGYISGYGDTLMGRALLGFIRVVGPRRALERMTQNFRTANNYTRAELAHLEPGHSQLRLSRVHFHDFYRGLLEAALEASGAQEARVTLARREDDWAVFDVRWR
ncbi:MULTISPECIES: DUF2378 family protein [Myxococcaceae]|uniref:DUF2378 family protein n=1 Tax=Myxococcaceae TaxID=31 RepID=UPI00188E0EB7|nr:MULTISPECIES: DUF2378 family protein [Myxococcaceae]MBF5043237.1 DUF2378 family protein [Simulacricoccus sp. 17bor-14]